MNGRFLYLSASNTSVGTETLGAGLGEVLRSGRFLYLFGARTSGYRNPRCRLGRVASGGRFLYLFGARHSGWYRNPVPAWASCFGMTVSVPFGQTLRLVQKPPVPAGRVASSGVSVPSVQDTVGTETPVPAWAIFGMAGFCTFSAPNTPVGTKPRCRLGRDCFRRPVSVPFRCKTLRLVQKPRCRLGRAASSGRFLYLFGVKHFGRYRNSRRRLGQQNYTCRISV